MQGQGGPLPLVAQRKSEPEASLRSWVSSLAVVCPATMKTTELRGKAEPTDAFHAPSGVPGGKPPDAPEERKRSPRAVASRAWEWVGPAWLRPRAASELCSTPFVSFSCRHW